MHTWYIPTCNLLGFELCTMLRSLKILPVKTCLIPFISSKLQSNKYTYTLYKQTENKHKSHRAFLPTLGWNI